MSPATAGRMLKPDGSVGILKINSLPFAQIAQLVEHPLGKGKVKDSSSFLGSKKSPEGLPSEALAKEGWPSGSWRPP